MRQSVKSPISYFIKNIPFIVILNGLDSAVCAQCPPVATVRTDNSTLSYLHWSLRQITHECMHTYSHTHTSPVLVLLGLGVKHSHLDHWLGSLSVCNRHCQMSEASGCKESFSCKEATMIQSSQQTTQWPPKQQLRSHLGADLKRNDTSSLKRHAFLFSYEA